VLVDEHDVRFARLALCIATKNVLAAVLDLMASPPPT